MPHHRFAGMHCSNDSRAPHFLCRLTIAPHHGQSAVFNIPISDLATFGGSCTSAGLFHSHHRKIGSIVGIVFFSPWGIIIGPFGGAFIGELLGDRSAREALKSGMGALIGFLVGTVFKVVVCGYFVWCFVKALV